MDVIKYFKNNPDRILFIDEIHTLIGGPGGGTVATSDDDGANIANILKPALARGELAVIGSTTYDEYALYFQNDSAFSRRFQPVFVKEPSPETALLILQGLKYIYEEFHTVTYTEKALEAAVYLSVRYLPARKLPDKAIDLIDEAGSAEYFTVTEKAIQKIIHQQTGIPMSILEGQSGRIPDIQGILNESIMGQPEAMASVSAVIKRVSVDFRDPKRPAAALLFQGPSSVGKTETAKLIARLTNRELIRLDMSEYMEPFSVASLIGTPPGFIGFEEGGKLTKQIKQNPYSLILFDEIDKAHPDIYNILLQLLDEGRLSDALGKTYNAKNCFIILTSNSPAKFRPELVNRFDEIIEFKELDRDTIRKLTTKYLRELAEKLQSLGYEYPLANLDLFRRMSQASNARDIKRNISNLEKDIADYILNGASK